ncbi:TatD family hydrolase [Desulfosoma caldarium]|uniref:TatD DNase family protein n=1 Tax=Desulfosoma caldarium TaxID=610254 RepID=A0A3N1VNH5_9BACT|nr:TatD family hydrolase [Desulfosoma caldarium]ROR01762.1 TatD DNase family protein [Desulfosoma caldarium]
MDPVRPTGGWLIDTHAHLDFPELSTDLDGVFARCRAAQVAVIVTIGIDAKTSRTAVELSRRYPHVYATVGLHPHGARRLTDKELRDFADLAAEPKVVAIGEMGLDYYRDRQPRETQRRCLEQQLELAVQCQKPGVFHIREAHEDFLRLVKPYVARLKPSVLHCFSGDWKMAVRCLDLGFYLSIPGTVTYKNAQEQQKVVRMAPLDRLLVETDAPFLTPVPFRGKPNEPAYVRYTAEKIAELRGCSLKEVAEATSGNAQRVFGWTF